MPEDLKVLQISSSLLPPPFRGLHSPGIRKLSIFFFAYYFQKSSISLVNILPMALPLLPNTGYTWGIKRKDAFLSVTIQFRGLVSLTWMAHINTCSYIDGTGTTISITLHFGLWLNTHSGMVCGEKWLDRTVPGKKCLNEIQERREISWK